MLFAKKAVPKTVNHGKYSFLSMFFQDFAVQKLYSVYAHGGNNDVFARVRHRKRLPKRTASFELCLNKILSLFPSHKEYCQTDQDGDHKDTSEIKPVNGINFCSSPEHASVYEA